ncbi:MAG: hypothetical protein WCC18_18610 [Candidatus Acidiferrales bacterium]
MSTSVPVNATTPDNSVGHGASGSWDAPAPERGVLENLVGGFQEGAAKTATGLANLAARGVEIATGQPKGSLQSTFQDNREQPSVARNIGEGAENVGEYITGDAALDAGLAKAGRLVSAAKNIPLVAETLEAAKNHPLIARMIESAAKGATVGGTQGAVKGSASQQTAAGAEGGAAGGALGGAAAETITPIARLFGLGGLDSTEAMIKAGRPNVNEGRTFATNVKRAMPLLVEADKAAPVKTVQDFVDLAHDTANNLWENTIAPQVERHANEVIDGRPIAQRIRQALPEGTMEMFPDQAAHVENMAQMFADSKLSMSKADNYLRTLNAELKGYYNMPPASRYAAGVTNGRLAAMSEAADALRDSIYGKLEDVGEQTPRDFRQQYGALKQIESVFNKRATVEARQAPMNLQQVLGATEAVGALLSGHPVVAGAGLVPSIAKARQTSGSLIRQGLSAAARETEGAPIREAAKAAIPNITSQVGQNLATDNEGEQQQ